MPYSVSQLHGGSHLAPQGRIAIIELRDIGPVGQLALVVRGTVSSPRSLREVRASLTQTWSQAV